MGFSLNRAEQGETPFEQYEDLYREMVARVSHHVLELLHDAPDGQNRQQLLFFTESLGSLGNPLYSLLEQIFRKRRWATPAICNRYGWAAPSPCRRRARFITRKRRISMKPVPPGAFTTRAELRQAGARGAAAVFTPGRSAAA